MIHLFYRFCYIDSFKNDLYDSEGKLYINNSLYYSGLFKLGQQNGSGKLYKNNKIIFDELTIIVKMEQAHYIIMIVKIYYITDNFQMI